MLLMHINMISCSRHTKGCTVAVVSVQQQHTSCVLNGELRLDCWERGIQILAQTCSSQSDLGPDSHPLLPCWVILRIKWRSGTLNLMEEGQVKM